MTRTLCSTATLQVIVRIAGLRRTVPTFHPFPDLLGTLRYLLVPRYPCDLRVFSPLKSGRAGFLNAVIFELGVDEQGHHSR
jgi:hypothetical protein